MMICIRQQFAAFATVDESEFTERKTQTRQEPGSRHLSILRNYIVHIHIHTTNALSTILWCMMRCDDDIRYFFCSQRLLSGEMYILNRPINTHISITHIQMISNCILITTATKQRMIFVQKKGIGRRRQRIRFFMFAFFFFSVSVLMLRNSFANVNRPIISFFFSLHWDDQLI